VTKKTEALTTDFNEYHYDSAGRMDWVRSSAFVDHSATSVKRLTQNIYDGLGNLKSTSVNKEGATTGARTTTYSYGAGGRLTSTTDSDGFTRSYGYDLAGRVLRESWQRLSDGVTINEANLSKYDLAGRQTFSAAAKWSGTAWTLGDQTRLQYNTFGEIATRGVGTTLWQEYFEYDKAGRLWKTNEGDGVAKLFVYDGNGNQTLAITSSGTNLSNDTQAAAIARLTVNGTKQVGEVAVAGVVATITLYDRRDLATETRQPQRELSATTKAMLTTAKTYNAFGEVASETSSGLIGSTDTSYVTTYTYNSLGKLVQTEWPTVAWTSETGVDGTARPTQINYYDLSGRLIGVKGTNGYLNTRSMLVNSGHGGEEEVILKEFHADGGIFQNRYDVFGDRRGTTNEVGRTEAYVYDGMGRLIEQQHELRAGSVQLTDYYDYDGLGQRTKHWNSIYLDTATNQPIIERTEYDAQGRVIKMTDLGGNETEYVYTFNSAWETIGLGTFGGWQKTTYDAGVQHDVVKTDLFGRVIDRLDFGGHDYDYAFDAAGRLVTTSIINDSITNGWYNSGQAKSVVSDELLGTTRTVLTSDYQYDVFGRRTFESYKGQVTLNGGSPTTTQYQDAVIAHVMMIFAMAPLLSRPADQR